MACRRCHGFMIEEYHSDLMLEGSFWRCINCGAISDPNMRPQPDPTLTLQAVGGKQRRVPRPAGTSLR